MAAFEVNKDKIGKDLSEAIWVKPNCCEKFSDVQNLGVKVSPGIILDGAAPHMRETFNVYDDSRDQVAANANGFSMARSFTAVGNSVSDFDADDGGMLLRYETCTCLTQHRIFAELCVHFGEGLHRTLGLQHAPDFSQLRRIIGDCFQNSFIVNAGSFRPTADQRINRTDQDVMRADNGIRNLVDDDILQPFSENLFHEGSEQLMLRKILVDDPN